MQKENLTIKKFIFKSDSSNYIIYLFPGDDDYTDFYIQKEGYGFMSLEIGIDLRELEISIENFIESNIESWITDCELDILKIEHAEN